MSDFISFVENESTLVKPQHEFYKDAEFYKVVNLTQQEKDKLNISVVFDPKKPQTLYNRSVVRQFLYEYIVKRFRSSRLSTVAY